LGDWSSDVCSSDLMGYEGSATDTIPLKTSDAKIARVTTDISTPQKAAAITWTVASGAAQ